MYSNIRQKNKYTNMKIVPFKFLQYIQRAAVTTYLITFAPIEIGPNRNFYSRQFILNLHQDWNFTILYQLNCFIKSKQNDIHEYILYHKTNMPTNPVTGMSACQILNLP